MSADDDRSQQAATLFAEARETFPDVPIISIEDCRARVADGTLVLLDVREPAEQQVSMIPGAHRHKAFEADRKHYEGRSVATYCTMGYRAGLYAHKLRDKGWDALALDGSLLGWVHAGHPVENADGPTRRVHLFIRKFDLLPAGYEGILGD